MATYSGGLAFPVVVMNGDGEEQVEGGLTKREWFAGMAMQELVWRNLLLDGTGIDHPERIAKCCYQMADVMIEEGKKE
jgi:hypothetical protein